MNIYMGVTIIIIMDANFINYVMLKILKIIKS